MTVPQLKREIAELKRKLESMEDAAWNIREQIRVRELELRDRTVEKISSPFP